MFFPRVHLWAAFETISGPQAAFKTTFKITGDCRKARNKLPEEAYWKDFTVIK
jgi:hypothetical protein